VGSSVMGIFTRGKDLERARIEKERLERELANRTRRDGERIMIQETEKRRLEYELAERTRRDEERIRADSIREYEEERLREKERRKREEERRQHEMELAAIRDRENARLEEERQKQLLEDQAIRDAKDRRNAKLKKMKEASPETLQDLRALIRNRYELDIELWGLRSAREPDRPKVLEKMVVADAIMEDIMTTISTWENQQDGNWDEEEWERVQEIKERLLTGGMRVWEGNPPWADADNAGRGRIGTGKRRLGAGRRRVGAGRVSGS